MKGFKEFIMRGNLVEIAVAFIMATSFAAVVTALVAWILDLISMLGLDADFGASPFGVFLTALLSFITLATVVYFLIITPYNKFQERRAAGLEPSPEAPAEDIALLQEIRDLLAARNPGGDGPA